MATFVIVHGGFSGGWEWTPVARQLRGLGHEVYTPTLSGMGERSHLSAFRPVGMSTHIQDVVGVLEFEDLHNVVLIGSGYGGIPVTCAADRAAHRVGLVVYLDALVPYDGECALDLLPPAFGDFVRDGVALSGESWKVPTLVDPLPPATFETPEERAAYRALLRDQPVMSFVEPVYLSGAINHVPRAFLRCTMTDLVDEEDVDPIADMVERATDGFWHYRELPATHDPHLSDPAGVVRALTELVAKVLDQIPDSSIQLPTQLPRHAAQDKELEHLDWLWNQS